MKVMKFGGTSVGSVNSILSVKQIVEAVEEPVIVVVSALGGITDKLIFVVMLGETKVDSLPDLKWLGGQNGKRSWNKNR